MMPKRMRSPSVKPGFTSLQAYASVAASLCAKASQPHALTHVHKPSCRYACTCMHKTFTCAYTPSMGEAVGGVLQRAKNPQSRLHFPTCSAFDAYAQLLVHLSAAACDLHTFTTVPTAAAQFSGDSGRRSHVQSTYCTGLPPL